MNKNKILISLVILILIIIGMYITAPDTTSSGNRPNTTNETNFIKPELNSNNSSLVANNHIEQDMFIPTSTQEEPFELSPNFKLHKEITLQDDFISLFIGKNPLQIKKLSLTQYQETTEKDSNNVSLLKDGKEKYRFIQFGWSNINHTQDFIQLPSPQSQWQVHNFDKNFAEFSWTNEQNITFVIRYEIQDKYLIHTSQYIINNSKFSLQLVPYGIITNTNNIANTEYSVAHQGFIGNMNGLLEERSYSDIADIDIEKFSVNNINGWIGITDQYWVTSLIPERNKNFVSNFRHNLYNGAYQADYYIPQQNDIAQNGQQVTHNQIYVGPKTLSILSDYEEKYNLPLFEKTIDFGILYILTKPIFLILHYLYETIGSFAWSIILLTIFVKLLMFPISNASFKTMHNIKELSPEVGRLKTLYIAEPMKLQQETMKLYQKHSINPLSGCLPILIQIPVFFALYKVFMISIDMRHEPFIGWIDDLSIPDPTNILNLFGLLPYDTSNFFTMGIWSIIMTATVIWQQRMNSAHVTDPIQKQVMNFLPYIFLFISTQFPAGLVIYWSWSNILSILQQLLIQYNLRKSSKILSNNRKNSKSLQDKNIKSQNQSNFESNSATNSEITNPETQSESESNTNLDSTKRK